MKLLVTGGAGFIGSHLVEALVDGGHKVVVLDDLSGGNKKNLAAVKGKITFVEGDVRDGRAVKKAMAGCEGVFHLAAIASVPYSIEHPLETHEVNVMGTLSVLLAAKEAGVRRVVVASSAAVYGSEPGLPKRESSPLEPQSPYALQKLAAEKYALLFNELYGVEAVALRFFNVYGPRQDPGSPYSGVISKFVAALKEGKQPVIFGDGSATRDFVFVKDVVKACVKAMEEKKAAGQVFNIATGTQVSVKELFDTVKELLGISVKPKFKPSRPGDVPRSVADVSAARKVLGFAPETSLRDGLAVTIEES